MNKNVRSKILRILFLVFIIFLAISVPFKIYEENKYKVTDFDLEKSYIQCKSGSNSGEKYYLSEKADFITAIGGRIWMSEYAKFICADNFNETEFIKDKKISAHDYNLNEYYYHETNKYNYKELAELGILSLVVMLAFLFYGIIRYSRKYNRLPFLLKVLFRFLEVTALIFILYIALNYIPVYTFIPEMFYDIITQFFHPMYLRRLLFHEYVTTYPILYFITFIVMLIKNKMRSKRYK